MENSYNKEFEQFVKQHADQYRMFPSEKVWRGINSAIHTRRRWYGIGLALLLLTTGLVTWVMLISPPGQERELVSQPISAVTNELASTATITHDVAITPVQSPTRQHLVGSPGNHSPNLFLASPDAGSEQEAAVLEAGLIAAEVVAPSARSLSQPGSERAVISQPELLESALSPGQNTLNSKVIAQHRKAVLNTPVISRQELPVVEAEKSTSTPVADLPVSFAVVEVPVKNDSKTEETKQTAQSENLLAPYTIESVLNTYRLNLNARKRWSWQVYFVPTVSYRKLSENKQMLLRSQTNMTPLNFPVTDDINNVVQHKPDLGLELGINAGYPVARNLKITGGVQVNVSKYDIKAYPYAAEEALIVLSRPNGLRSVSTTQTNFRAQESFTKPKWLSTLYVSVSAPVGAELKLVGQKRSYLGIGGTLQPTYILEDRAYLISTDFKNYTTLPSLTRKFNMSTSFEVFGGFTTGKLRWKAGPQIRYQLMSSFDKKYPVKEHIIDYGLKVGLMLR